MPLIYAVIGCVGLGIWGYCVYPATMNSIITRAGLATLSQGDSLMIGINCAVVGLAAFFLGTAAMPRVMKSKGRIAVTAAAVIVLAAFGGVVLAMTWSSPAIAERCRRADLIRRFDGSAVRRGSGDGDGPAARMCVAEDMISRWYQP